MSLISQSDKYKKAAINVRNWLLPFFIPNPVPPLNKIKYQGFAFASE